MSAAANTSATVSFRSPQEVEVVVDGGWAPGAMLGWRHDPTGGCEAWVRLRDAAEAAAQGQERWVDLAAVRLPERHLSLALTPAAAPSDDAPGPVTVAMPAVDPSAATRGARTSRRPGRRHGGDVTAEQPAVGSAAMGRHRAPDDPGRHRATTAEVSTVGRPAPSGAGSGAGAAPEVVPGVGPGEEQDMLTRPMRLGDLLPHHRGGRPAVRPAGRTSSADRTSSAG